MANTRFPEQWRIITKHVNFKDKTVLDLGCGQGELLYATRRDGSNLSVGLDLVPPDLLPTDNQLVVFQQSIEDYIENNNTRFDVTICFSVLPYLDRPAGLLGWMLNHSRISLIECQYAGDGPGFSWIETDEQMAGWLGSFGWESIEAIGKTHVTAGRDCWRTIWLCKH